MMISRTIVSVLLGIFFMLFLIMIVFIPYAIVSIAAAFLVGIAAVIFWGVGVKTAHHEGRSKIATISCPSP